MDRTDMLKRGFAAAEAEALKSLIRARVIWHERARDAKWEKGDYADYLERFRHIKRMRHAVETYELILGFLMTRCDEKGALPREDVEDFLVWIDVEYLMNVWNLKDLAWDYAATRAGCEEDKEIFAGLTEDMGRVLDGAKILSLPRTAWYTDKSEFAAFKERVEEMASARAGGYRRFRMVPITIDPVTGDRTEGEPPGEKKGFARWECLNDPLSTVRYYQDPMKGWIHKVWAEPGGYIRGAQLLYMPEGDTRSNFRVIGTIRNGQFIPTPNE